MILTYQLPPLTVIQLLVAAHFIFDFPLQGDYLAKAKHPENKNWLIHMTAHCYLHAIAVAIITNSTFLGLAEFILHFKTDYDKCMNKLTFNEDQLFHLIHKATTTLIYNIFIYQ